MICKHPLAAVFVILLPIGLAMTFFFCRPALEERPESAALPGAAPEPLRVRQIEPGQLENDGFHALLQATPGLAHDKGRVHYFADGLSLSDPASTNRQATWVCVFNPTGENAQLKFTFFYVAGEPTSWAWSIPPETSRSVNLFQLKEIRHNQRFGARIESSQPVVAQVSTGYYGAEDKKDWYTRAMHSVICATTLARIHYYADGLVLDQPSLRLKEPEWAFLLNPNPQPAKVLLFTYYAEGVKKIHALEIPPQRLFPLQLDAIVLKNKLFGARFVSDVPLAVQQTRWVEEEDRRTIRSSFSVMAVPGDLDVPEAD